MGGKKQETARAREAKGKCGKRIRSFVLRTYIVGRLGLRKLHINWWVKVVSASPRVT